MKLMISFLREMIVLLELIDKHSEKTKPSEAQNKKPPFKFEVIRP